MKATIKIDKDDMGDELCKHCPLEKKGVYGVDGGYMAGCEGCKCDDAYNNYLDSLCEHPDEALIRDKPTEFCLACNKNIPEQK